jgi:hypothetical protein
MVNRVIREDPSKSSMHNRQPVTPKLLWKGITDYDLWPIYILGLMFQTPMTTPTQYLTLSLGSLGFDTFKTNLLVIPSTVFHMITMMGMTYFAEVFGELTLTAMIGQIWALPFIIYIYAVDINSINKWAAWGLMTALLSYPSGIFFPQSKILQTEADSISAHPIQVGWNSRNSNSVRSRTVSAALYNMFVQASGIIASNIYRAGMISREPSLTLFENLANLRRRRRRSTLSARQQSPRRLNHSKYRLISPNQNLLYLAK